MKSKQLLMICNTLFVAALLIFRGLRLIAWAMHNQSHLPGAGVTTMNNLVATMREDNLNEYNEYISSVYEDLKKEETDEAKRLS